MRALLAGLLVIPLAWSGVASSATGGTDSQGWFAITYDPPKTGESGLTVRVAPGTEIQIGYLLVRAHDPPAGFAHTFLDVGEGRRSRWDVSSGVGPRLNSWNVTGSASEGVEMKFGLTSKFGAAPTQILVWVAGDAPSYAWAFDGTALAVREGEGAFLAREDDLGADGAFDATVANGLTGMFSVTSPACAAGACAPPHLCLATCVRPIDTGRWQGPDGASGGSTRPASYGGMGPEGWFTNAPAGPYRFQVVALAPELPPAMILGGIDAAWLDESIPRP